MNINKRLKPNLVDPIIGQKIVKTLKPLKEDYWEPTRNIAKSFYNDYIKPNFGVVIFIIIIIILLIYRYRVIKSTRENKLINKPNNPPANTTICNKNNCKDGSCAIQQNNANDIDEYSDALIQLYNQQKENSREPKIKNPNKRMQPANGPKLAYPMYAYVPGGSLAPSGSR